MKKTLLSLLVFAMSLTAMAEPIEREIALQLANRFMSEAFTVSNFGRHIPAARTNLVYIDLGFDNLYTFRNDEGGFVVVAGDDRIHPILAYSLSDRLDFNIPESMRLMLCSYDQQISRLSGVQASLQQVSQPQREIIRPLIQTMWHQYLPFSYGCPFDDDIGRNTFVGCSALTLAQLMNYYQYPVGTTLAIPAYISATGYSLPALEPTRFDYSKLHINYSYIYDRSEVDANDESVKEVNKLMLYAGCALKMNYSTSGSSAMFDTDSIAKYFGYDKQCRHLFACNYPREVWEEMVYNELKAGRPVPYSAGAIGAQSHIFIIDGYDGQGYFHANIGEIGWGSDNVYYKLDVINYCDTQTAPISFSGYNVWQSAYFGFQPDKGNDALPQVHFVYGDYALPQTDYTRSGSDNDFQHVVLKADMKCHNMNNLTLDYGWGLFQNGLLKQVAGFATTSETTVSLNMPLNFGSTLTDGVYQFYPVYRYHGASEWESYREFGDTDDNGTPLRHYTATIEGNILHIGLSSLEPKITIDKVDYYAAYENEKLDVRAFLTNGGTNYENHLFVWVDGTMKSGIGTYVAPGRSGQADFCLPAPAKGTYDVKITTDDQGNDVVYVGQVTIAEAPSCTLSGKMVFEGVDESMTVYKNSTVSCTVTNTGETTFDNMIQALIGNYKLDEVGNYGNYPEIGVPSFPWRRFWYLHLEPGESVNISFVIGESFMEEEFGYTVSMQYYNNNYEWETLDVQSLSYVNHESTAVDAVRNQSMCDGDCYDLQGRRFWAGSLKSGIYIQNGKKLVIK